MMAKSRITTAGLVLLALLSVGPFGGCPPGSDETGGTGMFTPAPDPPPNQNYGLSDGEFILYSHPDDLRILGGLSEVGEGLTVYAEKDGNGLPTNLTALRYQMPDELGTDEATWVFFDDSGQLSKMLGVDGSTIEFDWMSATRVAVSAVSGDGSTQVNTTVHLPDSSSAKPKTATTARERAGTDVPISRSLGAKRSAWAAKDTVIVYVERCGRPVDGAEVFVTFVSQDDAGDPSIISEQFPARPTRTTGEYEVRLPVREAFTDATDGEMCQAIADGLGNGCTFAQIPGGQDLLCLELGTAVAAGTLHPPAGGGTFALCEATFKALTVYCGTLGASAGPGAPSLADAICDQVRANEASGLVPSFSAVSTIRAEIQAFARLPGVPLGTSQPLIVPATGPFPELSIDLEDTEVLDRFSIEPADPEPGEEYIATARLSCIPPGSVIRMSIARRIGGICYYADSTEITVRGDNPDPVIDMPVPGAREEAADMLTVEVVGGDLKRDIYVDFDSDSETEGVGCGVSDGLYEIVGFINKDGRTMAGGGEPDICLSGAPDPLRPTTSWSTSAFPDGIYDIRFDLRKDYDGSLVSPHWVLEVVRQEGRSGFLQPPIEYGYRPPVAHSALLGVSLFYTREYDFRFYRVEIADAEGSAQLDFKIIEQ
jgi:hypothetical protein